MAWRDDVLANNPTFYYEFEETSGTTAVDSGPNGYNGTIGAQTLLNQTGAHGKAFDFTRTVSTDDIWVAGPGVAALPTSQFLVECWAKQVSASGNPRLWETTPGLSGEITAIVDNTNVRLAFGSGGPNDFGWAHGGLPTDGNFHLYQFSYDGTNLSIIVDNIVRASQAFVGGMSWGAGNFVIGSKRADSSPATTDNFAGIIDDVAVYPVAAKTVCPSISFVGTTSSQGVSTGAKTRTLSAITATQVGDLLIAAISNGAPTNEVNPITAPDAGWTRIRRDVSLTAPRLVSQFWYKIATGASDGGGTWTFGTVNGSAEVVVMDVVAYRTTGSPWSLGNTGANITEDFVFGNGNTKNIIAPSVTASADQGQLLFCNFVSSDPGSALTSTLTLPGSLTQRYNQTSSGEQEANGEDLNVLASAASGTRTAVLTIVGLADTTEQIGQSVIFGTDCVRIEAFWGIEASLG